MKSQIDNSSHFSNSALKLAGCGAETFFQTALELYLQEQKAKIEKRENETSLPSSYKSNSAEDSKNPRREEAKK